MVQAAYIQKGPTYDSTVYTPSGSTTSTPGAPVSAIGELVAENNFQAPLGVLDSWHWRQRRPMAGTGQAAYSWEPYLNFQWPYSRRS